MNRFLVSVACFCLIFGVLGRELRRIEVIEPAVSFDDSVLQDGDGDDEYSEDSVEVFIAGQKRKYAIAENEQDHSSLKLQRDSLSSDSTDASNFDAIYAELVQKPSTCDCSSVPREPEDRRVRRSRLRVASFNAEWLFLFGGGGSVDCPGRGCPWQVRLCMYVCVCVTVSIFHRI